MYESFTSSLMQLTWCKVIKAGRASEKDWFNWLSEFGIYGDGAARRIMYPDWLWRPVGGDEAYSASVVRGPST